jgi:hypothetical protein
MSVIAELEARLPVLATPDQLVRRVPRHAEYLRSFGHREPIRVLDFPEQSSYPLAYLAGFPV